MDGYYLDSRGEFFSAKIHRKGAKVPEIKPLKSRQFLSMREQLSLSSRGITVALSSSLFSGNEVEIENYLLSHQTEGTALYEVSDCEWLYSVVGTNIKRILPDYQALCNLTTLLPLDCDYLLLYEENDHLVAILIKAKLVQSVNYFHLKELHSIGLSPLLERLSLSFKQQHIYAGLPEKTVLIGTVSKRFSTTIDHYWEAVSVHHLKAAGATLSTSGEHRIQTPQKRNLLRYFRRAVTLVSIVLLIALLGLNYILKQELNTLNIDSNISLFTPDELTQIDSLEKITTTLYNQITQAKEHHRWDLLLRKLGVAAKKNSVTLARFGSRKNNSSVEVLLRGTAKDEKSINRFITELEKDEYIKRITLSQLDKKNNNYEFSLQCLTTI